MSESPVEGAASRRGGGRSDGSLLGRIVDVFLQGDLAPLLILLSLLGGAVALWVTPREEEPQIVVPVADVFVLAPGLPAGEVERQVAEQTRLIDELRASLAQVKRLNGLLLICSCCKRIRKNDGEWQQMELFIREHSEADFSHGLCPECAEKTYTRFVSQMAHRLPD